MQFIIQLLLETIRLQLLEPIRYKIKFYQVAILLYIDELLTHLNSKYDFLKEKLAEQKIKLKILKFEQYKFKSESSSSSSSSTISITYEKIKDFKLFEHIQSMNNDCLEYTKTDSLFCEPYIHTGFRPSHKPYAYYVKSLFMKHNETINAWSHYMGALYTISLIYRYDLTDPYSWPILTAIFTSTIMFFTSASAHLMHSKSQKCHMNCFLCDFAGISFNVFGATFMQVYICSPIYYFNLIRPYILPLIGALSALCCLLNCLSQTVYHRPYPTVKRIMQFGPCAFSYVFAMIPILLQLINFSENYQINFTSHFLSLAILIIGACCFALDFPQRFMPGKFDFIGQGHHLFHLCIFLVEVFQLNACYTDYLANRDLIAQSRQPPTLAYCFLSLLIIIVYYVYMIRTFSKMVKHNFNQLGNFIQLEN